MNFPFEATLQFPYLLIFKRFIECYVPGTVLETVGIEIGITQSLPSRESQNNRGNQYFPSKHSRTSVKIEQCVELTIHAIVHSGMSCSFIHSWLWTGNIRFLPSGATCWHCSPVPACPWECMHAHTHAHTHAQRSYGYWLNKSSIFKGRIWLCHHTHSW